MIQYIDRELSVWGDWVMFHMEHSKIGHDRDTTIGRLMELGAGAAAGGSAKGAAVPDVMMPRDVQMMDRAIRDMPPKLREVAHTHYVVRTKPADSRERRRRYEWLDRLHYWIDGWIARQA